MSARPTVRPTRLTQGHEQSEFELLFSAVTELIRFQREVLQCVQRLEVSLDEGVRSDEELLRAIQNTVHSIRTDPTR